MNYQRDAPELETARDYLGLRIADLFRVEELIARGGSGHVFRAEQIALGRPVAIKVMHRHLLASRELRARFHREARIASRIAHPAVVPVLMTGELPDTPPTQGEAFIVYEFVPGRTLRRVLETQALTLAQSLAVLIAAAEAVGSAHRVGIVHRDLKPENLMLLADSSSSTQLRVLDFGLARLSEPTETPLTHTGAVLGTPNYLSPEGARGQPATPRSDVYSLAIIGYECLTGMPPFVDRSAVGVLMQQIERIPAPMVPTPPIGVVPPLIERAVMDNLDKSPNRRSADALEFAHRLRDAAVQSQVLIESFGPSANLWQTDRCLKDSPSIEPPASVGEGGGRSP